MSRVTIITATTGKKELRNCIESVVTQNFNGYIQHLIFADGRHAYDQIKNLIFPVDTNNDYTKYNRTVIKLPYSVGNNRWNGHRMYGAGTFLADEESEFVMFLDDDNTIDPDHIQNCVDVVKSGMHWAYSLRKIVSVEGTFLCNDDCESLGKWASVCHPQDYFIDVNCYFLPRMIAVAMVPIWYCKFREPGQPEIDRKISQFLRTNFPLFECTYKYSVNYAVASNSQLSVKADFFINGNAEMVRRYMGQLPWKK